jgi:hypothetical protein
MLWPLLPPVRMVVSARQAYLITRQLVPPDSIFDKLQRGPSQLIFQAAETMIGYFPVLIYYFIIHYGFVSVSFTEQSCPLDPGGNDESDCRGQYTRSNRGVGPFDWRNSSNEGAISESGR